MQNQLTIHTNALLRLTLERDELEYRLNWKNELIEKQQQIISELEQESGLNPLAGIEKPIISDFCQKHIQQLPIDDVYTPEDVKDCLATLKAKSNPETARKLLYSYGVNQVANLDTSHYQDICQKSVLVLNDFLKNKKEGIYND